MRIGGRAIAVDQPPYIIAEIGVNHDGSVDRAIGLVDLARDAGAEAVKLQYFEADRLLSAAARPAAYQRAAGMSEPIDMLRALELDLDGLSRVREHARQANLHAILTVFSVELVEAAEAIDWDAYKTASPDIINRPLIEALMATGRGLIVSTGAASRGEVEQAVDWLGDHPHLLMQCVSAYPTPEDCAALAGLSAIARISDAALGYSDHTTAVDTGALAVAAGARLLEKHITHDQSAAGPDHAASLDGRGFAEYVALAHRAWRMLGEPEKKVLDIEHDVRDVSRQSVVTTRDLPAGHVLQNDDVTIKRPGTGIAPARISSVVGRRLARVVAGNHPLHDEDLE